MEYKKQAVGVQRRKFCSWDGTVSDTGGASGILPLQPANMK